MNCLFCDDGAGCSRRPPRVCSEECAVQWAPFEHHCSEWAKQEPTMASVVAGISAQCEITTYGRYHPPSPTPTPTPRHGRCSDGDYTAWINQLSPACCGSSFALCGGTPLSPSAFEIGGAIPLPSRCGGGCPQLFEDFYVECHPRIEAQGAGSAAAKFLALCQDQSGGGGGGGHR